MIDDSLLDEILTARLDAPHWYVGFSGGLDSTALLQLLVDWRRRHPAAPPLTALHVHHGLQAAADDWPEQCSALCKQLDVPLIVSRVQVSGAGEEGARSARYAAFEQQLAAGEVLFLAHHLDDQVETFFLRLLRGAGLEGLAAIPAQRPLGPGELVRPLLGLERRQLQAFVNARGLHYVDDPSNTDIAMDRNYLRNEVLPLLAGRWPGYRATVSRAAGHAAAAARELEQGGVATPQLESVMGDPGLPLSALADTAATTAARTLRGWLRGQGYQAPDSAALEEFLRQLREGGDEARPRLQTGRYQLARYADGVFLLPEFERDPPGEDLPLAPGVRLQVAGVGTLWLARAARGSAGFELRGGEVPALAWRTGGERCRVAGRAGSASLKKILQEARVPPWWRQRVPLLYLAGELLCIGDLALCESSRLQTAGGEIEERWRLCWAREFTPSD